MRIAVIRVIDGDTIEGEFNKSILGVEIHATAIFRLYGIDTPEIRGETKAAGLAAKEYLTGRIGGQRVKAKITGKDSFGRWLAVLYLDGENINDELVTLGFAVYRTY